jgi:C_GCAxxG_C_C family probable redox protein
MNMKNEDIAVEKRNRGYNCAQAVVCTYCRQFNLDETTAFKISEGLGTGLGCTLGTCGALNAACMLAGMAVSTGNLEAPNSKGKTYPVTMKLTKEFIELAGASRCRDIKGIDTGRVTCECEECVRIACRLVDQHLIKDHE